MPTPIAIDKYQIMKPLGAGNYGQVYHVYDRALGAEKAIKVVLSTNPSNFMQSLMEAQILNKCKHKHIVAINEANIFKVNGTPRVVLDLEYIPEGSLEYALSNRWVSVKDTVNYVRGALLGLEHAHSHGFLHRDVKPGNILLASMAPKLSDFGLATGVGGSLIGSAQGYRPHLPPEYYTNPITTELTDVYAVGVTLFRSLSNISDWKAVMRAIPNSDQLMQAGTLVKRLGFEGFIPDSLKRIVRKACHLNSAKRFSSAHQFRQSLDRIRFHIDWIRLADNKWQGYCTSDKIHSCFTDLKSNKVSVTVNGRRDRSACCSFSTLSEAKTYMHRYVADTTLI